MSIPYTIVPANGDDGKAILHISREVGVFNPAEISTVEELWQEFIREGEESGYLFIVCRHEGQVVGFACYGLHPLTDATYDIYWIATNRSAQGKGIGRALIEAVEKDVQKRHGRLIVLETSGSAAYARTRRFYEGCGYRYAAVVHDFYADGDDLLIFSKRL